MVLSLSQCARFSGVAFKSTAVNWNSFIGELFKEYVEIHIKIKKLSGTVEIAESLFGRCVIDVTQRYRKTNVSIEKLMLVYKVKRN